MKGDFFVIKELYDRSIFIYTMIGLCTLGIIIKIILQLVYGSLAKASYNMGVSKNLLTQNMKKKFETCFKLKIGVNNVDIFVDKYLYRHKFCGILLSTWESICGQLLLSCVLIGSISTILGIVYQCGKDPILFTFTVGILSSGLLIFFEGLVNTNGKKEIIRINMKDYLENFLKVRLEQGELQPELIEKYKKELKTIEELTEQNSSPLTAATLEPKVKKGKIITPAVKETRKERKRKLKQANKRSAAEEKAQKKSIKKAKRKEKVLKKEDIKNKKLIVKEEKKKIKNDAKAAFERKREAEQQEIEKIRAEVKLEEDRKREEKRNQEEIKRVLMLEKTIQKEEKKKIDSKTLAQEKKEVLLKEINERRYHEALQSSETNLESNKNIHIIEVVPVMEENMHTEMHSTAREEVAVSSEGKLKLDTQTKVQLQSILNKGIKKGNMAEDKLIEDILKEFLS